jgi:serine/threonine protein kinase
LEKSQALALEGRYRLESRLAHNQVETWKAQCLKDNTWVVIKCLKLAEISDWKTQELFEREAKALKHLKHPAIPTYLDYLVDPAAGAYYLVHTWVEGQSLAQMLTAGQVFDEAFVFNLAEQILDILSYLHAFSPPVIHRDLKPSNLIWDGNQVHLIDFGGVLEVLTPQGGSTVTGTYGYMAPEQFAGKALPASDLYSLGATLMHLLSGQIPSELLNPQLQLALPEKLPISGRLRFWLEQLTAYQLAQRFQTAESALAQLQALSSQSILSVGSHPPPPETEIQLEHGLSQLSLRFREPYFSLARLGISAFVFLISWGLFAGMVVSLFPAFNGTWGFSLFFAGPIYGTFFGTFFGLGFAVKWLGKFLYTETALELNASGTFKFQKELFFRGSSRYFQISETGSIRDIQSLQKVIAYYQNRKPLYKLRLDLGGLKYDFGSQLSDPEKNWLQAEFLDFLSRQLSSSQSELLKARSEV